MSILICYFVMRNSMQKSSPGEKANDKQIFDIVSDEINKNTLQDHGSFYELKFQYHFLLMLIAKRTVFSERHTHTHTHRDIQGFKGGALGGCVFSSEENLTTIISTQVAADIMNLAFQT